MEICAVLADWGTSVVLLVSMKKEDIFLVWYTHNNQPYCMKMGEAMDSTMYSIYWNKNRSC